MVPFVPSDLVEYPIISYFKFRNKGKLIDQELSHSFISTYGRFYRKDPRNFFIKDFKSSLHDIKWGKSISRGPFLHSIAKFRSPYHPLSPILKETKYHPVLNMITHQYRYKDSDEKEDKKSAVLHLHGYAENTFFFHELSYFRLFRHFFNCNIFTLELPYHFHRQPIDSPFSGAYYLNGNPIRMLEAIRQSIQEILYMIQYLKEKYERIILFGVSLGGHLAALTTQFFTDVDIICALASPFLFNLNPKIVPVSTKFVSKIKENGHIDWYKILYVCNLKYFSPFTTNRHTAIIGGVYDRIVPFSRVNNLATLLHKPLFVYPGGHLSLIIWLRPLLHRINNFFVKK
ncbi:MAG: hypothetical protein ACFFB5_10875 [Promethearchaeota archaeon]